MARDPTIGPGDRQESSGGRRHRLRPYLGVLLTLLVVLAGGYAAITLLDTGAVVQRLGHADRRLLLAAGTLATIGWPLRGWRYRDVLAAMRVRVGIGLSTQTVVMSQTANLVVPARAGDGVRAALLTDRAGVPVSTGIASVLVERLLDVVAVLVLGGAGLLWLFLLGVGTNGWLAWGGGLLGIGLGGTGLLIVVISRYRARREIGWPGWVPGSWRRWIGQCVRSMALVGRRPRIMGRLTFASMLVWAVDVIVAGVVAIAVLGSSHDIVTGVGIGAITVAVAGGNLAKSVPLTQGGIGVYESAMAGLLLVVLPLSPEAALTVAVLDHAVKNGVTVLAGIVGSCWLHVHPVGRDSATNR